MFTCSVSGEHFRVALYKATIMAPNNTTNEEQKTVAVNRHPDWFNKPLFTELSLPGKLKHLFKQPLAKPWQNLHTTTQADLESTNNNC
jgi:hypothetical protein